jgi:uncharacterized protein YndB with AHSA1/START domain
MSQLVIRKQVEIDAPPSTIWKALTENEFIQQYMFNCVAETDWQPGSPLLWKGVADGKLYVKGNIVAVDAPHRLVYTVIDPNSSTIADIPANYLTMTFVLKPNNNHGSVLEVSQGDYSTVAEGQRRYKETLESDDMVLKGIKKVAEALVANAGVPLV